MSDLISTDLQRTTKHNPSDYGDFVKCTNCGNTMLVDLGEERCPECGTDGSLMWADEELQELEV